VSERAVAVHRVEVELGRIHDEVVLEVFRVRQGFEQSAALVERDFGLPVITYPRPCLRFLGEELHRDAVVGSYLGASAGSCDDSVAVPSGRARDALDRAFASAGMCPESAPRAQ
jgi:hypothetical protein